MVRKRTRRLAAVWFADIVGFTALASRDEDLALELVDDLQRGAERAVRESGGRVAKSMGDSVLAAFESVDAALRAALQLLPAFPSRSSGSRTDPASLRIGVHLGEISESPDGDILGDGVNVASRLQGVAEPGQILVSEAVYDQVRRRRIFRIRPEGTVKLHGLADPVFIYSLDVDASDVQSLPPDRCLAHGDPSSTALSTFLAHQSELYAKGDLYELLACVRTARGVHGDIADLWNNEGVALSDLGRYREALDCFERALELRPSWVNSWCNKGRALRALHRPKEALACYDRAIQCDPAEVIPYVNKANCLLDELGRRNEAAAAYRQALACSPSDQAAEASLTQARRALARLEHRDES